MDFLLVTIASVLFPYIFNLSGIDYQTNLGINTSLQEVNSYKLELVDKKSDYKITNIALVTYMGYGIKPDLFIDYALVKKRLWISPTFGFEPLTHGMQYRTQLKTGGSSSASSIFYNKGPYFGLKLGVNLFQSNQELKGYGTFGFTPYFVVGVVPISYESESLYQSSHEKRYNFYWGLGTKIDIKGPWSIYLQVKNVVFDTNGSSLNQQVCINETSYQFGLSYWFRTLKESSKLEKVKNYDHILNIINDSDKDKKVNSNSKRSLLELKSKEPTQEYKNSYKEQVKAIYNTSQQLKNDSKLVEKAKSKKIRELFNYEEASNIDF